MFIRHFRLFFPFSRMDPKRLTVYSGNESFIHQFFMGVSRCQIIKDFKIYNWNFIPTEKERGKKKGYLRKHVKRFFFLIGLKRLLARRFRHDECAFDPGRALHLTIWDYICKAKIPQEHRPAFGSKTGEANHRKYIVLVEVSYKG